MALSAPPQALPRRASIRFKASLDAETRAALGAALAAMSPAPAHRWDDDCLHIEYRFPDLCFDGIWSALRAIGLDGRVERWSRLRSALRALLEQNEREYRLRPSGWRQQVDRLYLVSAPEPGVRVTRRGGLWRKHEKEN